jgi:hypothetical protein
MIYGCLEGGGCFGLYYSGMLYMRFIPERKITLDIRECRRGKYFYCNSVQCIPSVSYLEETQDLLDYLDQASDDHSPLAIVTFPSLWYTKPTISPQNIRVSPILFCSVSCYMDAH